MPIDWKDLSKKSKHVPSFLKANFNFMPTLAYASLFHKLFPALKRLKQPKSQIFVKMPNISATQDQVFFQGFGTSLSWWANGIDKHASEMYANLFFGLDLVDTGSQHGVMPGLGMQVVRYNIGGCGLSTDLQSHPEYFPERRRIEGFWINPEDKDLETWDWSRDENQRRMLMLAFEKGAKTVEFFCNAPMYWMTAEKSSAGGKLLSDQYENFVYYAVSVVKKAIKDWGIPVHSLSLFNEPDAAWWFHNQTGQEGLNLMRKDQLLLLTQLNQQLKEKCPTTIISASDENSVFNAIHSFTYLNKRNVPISQCNLHGYFMLAPQQSIRARQRLRQICGDIPIWVSEFGNWHDGIPLAMQIFKDLKYLKPTAWVYWQSIDYGGWGLLDVDFNECRLDKVNKKYFVFAQFSWFIRAGDVLFDVDSAFPVIIAFDRSRLELKVIIVNEDLDRIVRLDFGGIGMGFDPDYQIVFTIVDGGPDTNLVKSTGVISAGITELILPANSVYSLRISVKTT